MTRMTNDVVTEFSVDADYGSRMFTDAKAREAEIAELKLAAVHEDTCALAVSEGQLPSGISVVIPSYRGVDRIGVCLQSLMEQDLPSKLFEVILVVNGEDDGTINIVKSFKRRFPLHEIRIFFQSRPNAGAARNLGISAARYEYTTFVDDDDYVGPRFLSSLLAKASPECVSISPIINVSIDGEEDQENALNIQILGRIGQKFKLISAGSLIGFNACKLFPTTAMLTKNYSEDLQSGEDVCFMASIAVSNDFDAAVSTIDPAGAYFRVMRAESISRQPLDFNFAVEQRLAVIRELELQRTWDGSVQDRLLTSLSNSQSNYLKRYLDDHPSERSRIIEAVDKSSVRDFPWSLLNADLARDLVVSYCFAPYSDTSATVASKAVVERGNIVDVIYNNMSKVRRSDTNLRTIAGRLIDKAVEIDAPASFAGWKQICEFVNKGILIADRQDARIGGYQTLYSRVLWPGSHFLAALFKLRHSTVKWTAEFSDPLSHDASGWPRIGNLERDAMFDVFSRAITAKGYSPLSTDSLFTWCEFITYVLADEIVFTNNNQLEYMLENIPDEKLRRSVAKRATVRVHPSPPKRSYGVLLSEYALSSAVINIGYFGAFYENRGLMEVLTALVNAPAELRRQVRLHVFTNKAKDLSEAVQRLGLTGVVKSQGYRPYLEFLNLTTRFDVLLVNDVERTGELWINPFLPSKYSDYLGSGVPVWGLVDQGSPLSTEPLSYKSEVGNGVAALEILRKIHSNWRGRIGAGQEVLNLAKGGAES